MVRWRPPITRQTRGQTRGARSQDPCSENDRTRPYPYRLGAEQDFQASCAKRSKNRAYNDGRSRRSKTRIPSTKPRHQHSTSNLNSRRSSSTRSCPHLRAFLLKQHLSPTIPSPASRLLPRQESSLSLRVSGEQHLDDQPIDLDSPASCG
jgi:hypothetical protein